MTAQPFVFSIRPEYVKLILDRVKHWEFRSRRPSVERGDMILIYETAPMSAIVGAACVTRFKSGTPADVWAATSAPARGIDAAAWAEYFDGKDRAYAMRLGSVVRFDEPQPLPPGMAHPQSWSRYKGVWS